ncbi:pinin/SDK/memA domain-containing protein [Blastomyces dermatitidis ATCC 18188]|uniref:Pinin/SDK/memA domain-containing protein n=1 Tax=Ajellomyces dermatitidis (strain ATCC 18188 / CBS 674.68) TaxID=653446 RepID=F2TDE3_AJEDA|nr:pinin/SDK/memA domain-containing protein [Blastomyces dermatitidis ATCC 18188]
MEETITSAVALPEQEESSDSRPKRRQSPADDNESKRRRLSADNEHLEPKENQTSSPTATTSKSISNATDQRDARRKSGVAEERKRGQRLFGALLGTLSQSSSTAAQKRRADIEKKQQAKLRMQEEEYNRLTRKKQEDLLAMRKKQQRTYDAQSMRLRHSNQLAMAHFLKTTTEPVLYYKPWELRPEEEARIEQQIEDCKAAIAREVEEFEAKNPPSPSDPVPEQGDNQRTVTDSISSAVLPGNNTLSDTQDTVHLKSDTVGADNNNTSLLLLPQLPLTILLFLMLLTNLHPLLKLTTTTHPLLALATIRSQLKMIREKSCWKTRRILLYIRLNLLQPSRAAYAFNFLNFWSYIPHGAPLFDTCPPKVPPIPSVRSPLLHLPANFPRYPVNRSSNFAFSLAPPYSHRSPFSCYFFFFFFFFWFTPTYHFQSFDPQCSL